MNISQLVNEAVRREGKKKSINIANGSELVARICDIFAELNPLEFINLVWKMRQKGQKRRV